MSIPEKDTHPVTGRIVGLALDIAHLAMGFFERLPIAIEAFADRMDRNRYLLTWGKCGKRGLRHSVPVGKSWRLRGCTTCGAPLPRPDDPCGICEGSGLQSESYWKAETCSACGGAKTFGAQTSRLIAGR